MSPPDDPIDAPELRWGVLAPGGIASTFTDALHRYTRSRVVAVGSRSRDRARCHPCPAAMLVLPRAARAWFGLA